MKVILSFSPREKELAAVKINASDIDVIANELEVSFNLQFTF